MKPPFVYKSVGLTDTGVMISTWQRSFAQRVYVMNYRTFPVPDSLGLAVTLDFDLARSYAQDAEKECSRYRVLKCNYDGLVLARFLYPWVNDHPLFSDFLRRQVSEPATEEGLVAWVAPFEIVEEGNILDLIRELEK
jgi:hypothetical protein